MHPILIAGCIGLALTAATATVGKADVITRCGASKGYAYYFEGPLVPREKSGWTSDGISKGGIQLVRDGKEFDIVYTDVAGTRSAKSDGFIVLNLSMPNTGFFTVLLVSEGTGVIEHYLFKLDAKGRGTVVWGSIKGGSVRIPKSAIYEVDVCGTVKPDYYIILHAAFRHSRAWSTGSDGRPMPLLTTAPKPPRYYLVGADVEGLEGWDLKVEPKGLICHPVRFKTKTRPKIARMTTTDTHFHRDLDVRSVG